jgi:putative phosphoesterase
MKLQNGIPIGIISDTHGYLPSKLNDIFKNVQFILHAGDFGGYTIYRQLQQIAPVLAVRGNNDGAQEYNKLSPTEGALLEDNSLLYMVHDLTCLPLDPVAARCRIIIHGHTHIPSYVEKNNIIYINPGSASFPRRGFKPSVGLLTIQNTRINWELVELIGLLEKEHLNR